MKTTVFILAMSLLVSSIILAQNAGSVKGRVLDSKTKEPLQGAHVYVEYAGSKIGTLTDNDGRFTLKPLNPGKYQVCVSFVGYNEKKIETTIFAGETTFMKDILLSDVIVIGGKDGIVVTDEKQDVRLIDPGQTNKIPIKSAELEKMPNSGNVAMVVRSISSEVQISDNGKDIVFRGSRNGSSAVYIDGVKQSDLSSTVPKCAIGSIMVYTGGIPAQYGDVTGGVVVIETKNYFSVRAEYNIKHYNKRQQNRMEEE